MTNCIFLEGQKRAIIPVEKLEMIVSSLVEAATLAKTLRAKLRDKDNPKSFINDVHLMESKAPTWISIAEEG